MKNWRRWAAIAGAVVVFVAGTLWYQLRYHRDISWYESLRMPEAAAITHAGEDLHVTWLGVSTLLIQDGQTAILTDGFFSRPGLLGMSHVRPDEAIIDEVLQRVGIDGLAAVIVMHSHYDHALDAPKVAEKTGALLVGSSSTANIGAGYGLPKERIRVVRDGDGLTFGRFKLRFVTSVHSPNDRYPGSIDEPLRVPAGSDAFRTGDCYSLFVQHNTRTFLVQASAGFVEGKLNGMHADTVYLGIGGLGKQPDEYREAYWREVVRATGARRVIPIHWDDFFSPLSEPLAPLPPFMDNFDRTMSDLASFAKRDTVDLRLPQEWVPADPFFAPK